MHHSVCNTFGCRWRKSQICIRNLSNAADSKNVSSRICSNALPPLPTSFSPQDAALDPVGLSTAGVSCVRTMKLPLKGLAGFIRYICVHISSTQFDVPWNLLSSPYKRGRRGYGVAMPRRLEMQISSAHSLLYRCKVRNLVFWPKE